MPVRLTPPISRAACALAVFNPWRESKRAGGLLAMRGRAFGGYGERFVAVLEIPPVDSPHTAVKMAIYSDIKRGGK